MIERSDVISFFDRCAPDWDAEMIRNEPVIRTILDNADIRAGVDVLDVACGTGVLFPDYLARDVHSVTGVDIAPEMARRAAEKFPDARVTVLCGDIVNGYRIRAFRVNHNVLCYGYTMEIDRAGKFDVERAKAANIPLCCWNPLQKGNVVEFEGVHYTPDMVLGEARKGIKLTYTTDTRPTRSIIQNAEHSDLFVCEGMYGEDDKKSKALEHKHMMFKEAAKLAAEAEVSELWLTHYSPSLVRPEEFMDGVREIFPNAYPGKDGKSTVLSFEEE